MPWEIKKAGKGYVVVTKATGKPHSKKPLSKEMARRQLAALHANVKE